METKLLPKYTNAVKFALKVLDEAFILEEPEATAGLPRKPGAPSSANALYETRVRINGPKIAAAKRSVIVK